MEVPLWDLQPTQQLLLLLLLFFTTFIVVSWAVAGECLLLPVADAATAWRFDQERLEAEVVPALDGGAEREALNLSFLVSKERWEVFVVVKLVGGEESNIGLRFLEDSKRFVHALAEVGQEPTSHRPWSRLRGAPRTSAKRGDHQLVELVCEDEHRRLDVGENNRGVEAMRLLETLALGRLSAALVQFRRAEEPGDIIDHGVVQSVVEAQEELREKHWEVLREEEPLHRKARNPGRAGGRRERPDLVCEPVQLLKDSDCTGTGSSHDHLQTRIEGCRLRQSFQHGIEDEVPAHHVVPHCVYIARRPQPRVATAIGHVNVRPCLEGVQRGELR
mmetsp:Transcript_90716/g.189624  ORF Transcript_90716/g.189624 Transcript_90716/m.189624 type:complete len:332 (+) Transcript_90716:367-1362(+)